MLDEFMNRELELWRKRESGELGYGDWLRHISESHVRLLQLVQSGPAPGYPILVEVMRHREDGQYDLVTFELPNDIRRIVVQPLDNRGAVCAFRPDHCGPGEEQVTARLVSTQVTTLLAVPSVTERSN
jgi:hypothetical protein